jgi:hypothetical protein
MANWFREVSPADLRTRRAELREERLRDGRCVNCASRKARPGKITCEVCGGSKKSSDVRALQRSAERRTRLGSFGMRNKPGTCVRCTAPALPGRKLCQGHVDTLRELAEEDRR